MLIARLPSWIICMFQRHARKRSTVSMVAMMKEESYSRILLRLQPAYSVLNARALGRHNFVSTSCLQPKVCTECTFPSKELTSHEYTDATCQKPATCKRCGDETGGKANHSFPKVNCTVFAKCKWCEATKRGEHQWVTEGKERICSVCQISQALKQPKPDPEYTE